MNSSGKMKMIATSVRDGIAHHQPEPPVLGGYHGHDQRSLVSQRWMSEMLRTIRNRITLIAEPPEMSCRP